MLKVLAVVIFGYLAVVTAKDLRLRPSNNRNVRTVVFKDCGSKGAKINSVSISPCPTEPCLFKKNSNVTVQVDFTADEDFSTAKNDVHGIIAGVSVPFPVPSDACKDMKCPVSTGRRVLYNNVIFVEPSYPKISLVVKWEVQDEKKEDVICFEVPVEIVS